MNIRRYMAKDMRSAFKLVRDELGPDVVILSTRRVKGQIELTVASDRNPVEMNAGAAVKPVNAATLEPRTATVLPTYAAPLLAPAVSSRAVQSVAPVVPVVPPASVAPAAQPLVPPASVAPAAQPLAPAALAATVASGPAISLAAAAAPIASAAAVSTAVDDELRALRRLLETQLAALSWNDMSRRSPIIAELLRELTQTGFSRELAADLLDSIDAAADLATVRRRARAALAARLAVTGDRWADGGGTVAVVGPAGAGKTTALAALAARWVMRNGTQGAALISVGESRFGVQENLARVGRLVGIPVYVLEKIGDLPPLLQRLADRRMILIDTAGCSPRSANFDRHVRELRDTLPNAEFALVLSAATQVGTLREVVGGYAALGRLAALVTHTDECTALGGLLCAAIEAGLPLAYTLDGQRLLDDLHPARAEALVARAFALAEHEREAQGPSSPMEALHGT